MKSFNQVSLNPLKTREDLQHAVKQLCEPLTKFYSEDGARLIIGNSGTYCTGSTAGMEAFARPLWGLVPMAAGGEDSNLWETYLQGVQHGTDPEHPAYWGQIGDKDQLMVEMAVLGLALSMIPQKIWEPLNGIQKNHFTDWLNQINHYIVVDSNWLFFRVLVNIGLKKTGAEYSSEKLQQDLDRLDQFYLGDGWYQDGISEQRDYYIPFAMHFYSLIYAKLTGSEDQERTKRYKERAGQFAQDFVYWFAKDGSALPFGRSLTYRFAQSAFWSALAFADVEALPWGVIKGIVLRNLRWWFKQPIFSTDGVLTIGYAYPNLNMAEGYNAPGSPYWALKTFLILALPEEHPFWQAGEEQFPPLPSRSVQQHPHMIICRQEEDRHVLAYTAGQHAGFEPVHGAAKYEKFVYSNLFGFSVPHGDYGLEQGSYDSMLAFSEGDNLYRVRRKCNEYMVTGEYVYSKWRPWFDVEVQTWIIPLDPWHVRIHLVKTERTLETAEGGFAISREKEGIVFQGKELILHEHGIVARFPWATSGILDLLSVRKPEFIRAESNTNLLEPRTMIPYLKGKLGPGDHLMACAVLGQMVGDAWQDPPEFRYEKGKINVKDSASSIIIEIQY